MKVMVDTNAYAAFKRGDGDVVEALARADEILISAIVLGELRAGFRLGSKEKENLQALDSFLSNPRVQAYSCGEGTSIFYAEVYARLREAGRPIPTNDLWIAATALETGSVLLTRDAHFRSIAGLITGP